MIRSIIELILAGFVIWAVFNENKFIKFEDKIKSRIFKR